MLEIDWKTKTFEELSTKALYEILQLRTAIFVVEQDCPYQECDGKDLDSIHVMGFHKGQLIAYARIVPKGISYQEGISIGRVVVDKNYRMLSAGIELMRQATAYCADKYPTEAVIISAQQYLIAFYEKFGFRTKGDIYLEDDIPHIQMVKPTLTKK